MKKLPIGRKTGIAITYITAFIVCWRTEITETHNFTVYANPLWCIGAYFVTLVATATLLAWITE